MTTNCWYDISPKQLVPIYCTRQYPHKLAMGKIKARNMRLPITVADTVDQCI